MGKVARLPNRIKRVIRRGGWWAAKVRQTRAWPLIRPAYRLVRRVINIDRVLGRSPATPGRSAAELEREKANRQVNNLRRRLREGGLTDRALTDLRELAAHDPDPYRRRLAAWELGLWYADQYTEEGARTALQFLSQLAHGEDDPERLQKLAVIEAECHQLLGDLHSAWRVVSHGLALGPNPNLFLAAARMESSAEDRVEWLNRAFAHYGIARMAIGAAATGATFDRLVPASDPVLHPPGTGGPLVSVIIPVHNSADVIHTALDSVLSQTWRNLEVIVVDDASSDSTATLVSEHRAADNRVHLIKAAENGGTYVARNLALRAATGEFVTCHDADDWSHPEKLERQVRHLQANPSIIANSSQQVRATSDLSFHRRGKPGYFVFNNLSSLMFRRTPVTEALGYWDSVRFGADAELIRRLRRVFGTRAVAELGTGPICLQRQSNDSLTGDGVFGYPGYFMGARMEYFESYCHYIRKARSLWYEFPQEVRPFPVPEPMRPRRGPRGCTRHFDVVLASDFRLPGGSTGSSVEEVKAQRRMGLRTGLIQMSYYDADPTRAVLPVVRDLLDDDRVQMLVHGEKIHCDLLIVRYPPVLAEWQRFLPEVEAEEVRIIVNQPPMSDYGPDAEVRYHIPRCHEHIQKYYGKPGVWHPIGPLVRRALREHHHDELHLISLSDEDWVNIIDGDEWRRSARPPRGRRIRIGRHSRDSEVKWPDNASELLSIYPDAPGYEVHVLGGAKAARSVLGYLPDNWRVRHFGEVPPRDFLAGLDVFVYYTNPSWVESFGRVILEAMAVGVPAVLPYSYEPLFGDAAVYAEPSEVRAVVDRLMSDDGGYQAQVDSARRYVEKTFGYSRHAERVRRFVKR